MIQNAKYSRGREKGFTLVELLAVIVILAIILVIAVPKVMSVIEDAKKATLESTAKMIASGAEKQKVQNTVLGNTETITCDSVAKINKGDYANCSINFDNNTAKVTIEGKGKFKGLFVCNGTKTDSEATEDSCENNSNASVLNCTYDSELVQGAEFIYNQYTYRYKQEYNDSIFNWQNIEQDGWGVILTDKQSTAPVNTPVCTYINGKPIVSTSYMFKGSAATIIDLSKFNTSTVTNMRNMFASTQVTSLDLRSLDTSNVTDMSSMFSFSSATSIDLSNFNTSKVTNMNSMFQGTAATSLDLRSLDTSNVTNMSQMFSSSAATELDLSSFNTSNVTIMEQMFSGSAATTIDLSSFDTSNVTSLFGMFMSSKVTSIDISNFDISNVSNLQYMFDLSALTTVYVRSEEDISRFNVSTWIPETLKLIVKNNG